MTIWEIIKGVLGFITADIKDFLEKYSDVYRLLGLVVLFYGLDLKYLLMLSKNKKKFQNKNENVLILEFKFKVYLI